MLLSNTDLLCFSHLRWDFVYQRPQHLMARFAKQQRVYFIEEPIFDADYSRLDILPQAPNLWRVVPHMPSGLTAGSVDFTMARLLTEMRNTHHITTHVSWYYTPMAMGFTSHLQPCLTVYDCMDELSAFRGAPPQLLTRETELLQVADLVFTGGHSLYHAKANRHSNVYAFPSSVDRAHFGQARTCAEASEQAMLPHPRLGFFGVIDERMDLELLAGVAGARPEWQIVMVGPVVKIDPATLPQLSNLHYLGGRSYPELPHYLAGWDVALLPFARNESTRFISPTKTPEYLAGGKPVVSTSIQDVVQPYGALGLVQIADSVPDFVTAVENALQADKADPQWLARVDHFLAGVSWDTTWNQMTELMERELAMQTPMASFPNHAIPLHNYWSAAD